MANLAMLGHGADRAVLHDEPQRASAAATASSSCCGRDAAKTKAFAEKLGHPALDDHARGGRRRRPTSTSWWSACRTTCTAEAVRAAARPARASCAPSRSARTAAEAREMLEVVEKAGVFHGYLEDLVYTPKTLKALAVGARRRDRPRAVDALARGAPRAPQRLVLGEAALGRRRDRRHGLPLHRDRPQLRRQGGAARSRSSAGARRRCTRSRPRTRRSGWCATPSGALAQFEVAWTFRGGMDLRDEVSGTDGTILLNHWLRTGFEMFSAPGSSRLRGREGRDASRAGCSRSATRWRRSATRRCSRTCSTPSTRSARPTETFYDGYVVNAIMDACYRSIESRRWERVRPRGLAGRRRDVDDARARRPSTSGTG